MADLVFLFQVLDERIVVSDIAVLNTEVIDDKSERDARGSMGEKTRDVRVLDVTNGCKMVYKVLAPWRVEGGHRGKDGQGWSRHNLAYR